MMEEATSSAGTNKYWRRWVVFWAALILAIFIGANIHYLVVALDSQPDCLPHLKAGQAEPGQYAAAKSSC